MAGILPIPSVASPPEGSDFASPPCPCPRHPWLMGEPGSLRQREGLGKVPECCSLWQPVLDERCPDHGRGLSRKAPASSVRTLVLICAPLLFPEALHPFHPQSRALCLPPPGPPLSAQCSKSCPPQGIALASHTCVCVYEFVCVWGGDLENLYKSSEPGSSQRRRGFRVPRKRPRTQGGRDPDGQHSA